MATSICGSLIRAGRTLSTQLERLAFSLPVTHVYNPHAYAWEAYETYLRKYGASAKSVLFLGMNPGPFGMAQTGVPFGEVCVVRDWLKIQAAVGRPAREHPRRPVTGFECPRSEVSGRRLWGLFAERFGGSEAFFSRHLVLNYCPLLFIEAGGRNRTPDKLPAHEAQPVFEACDEHLRAVVRVVRPDWVIGVGKFAAARARRIFPTGAPRVESIPHPSPANPAANRGWATDAKVVLEGLGVWEPIRLQNTA